MTERETLPAPAVMYRAMVSKNEDYEGIFVTAVRTTGIFCRPTCSARKPLKKNVEFYSSSREALLAGYRPCKVCRPLSLPGESPSWMEKLLGLLDREPARRIREVDLRDMGLSPTAVRRWFRKSIGMTFQGYQRSLRLGRALGRLKQGDDLTQVAYDHGYESLSGFRDAFRSRFRQTPGNGSPRKTVTINRIRTPLGPMIVGVSNEGVCLLEFLDRSMVETQIDRLQRKSKCSFVPGNSPLIDRLASELDQYFSNRLREFSIRLDLAGSEFQKRVWEGLRCIPYGETRSYQQQAALIGHPSATRAVARANGDNRIAIVVPCHRVIGSDGKLCGYGGGLWRKKFLLDLEQRALKTSG
jgi:AraC family transcriptional regulator of adaptative response/methylated-DNA-[protein]-cysteine methyltransferase